MPKESSFEASIKRIEKKFDEAEKKIREVEEKVREVKKKIETLIEKSVKELKRLWGKMRKRLRRKN